MRVNISAQGSTGVCCTAGSAAMCSGCGYYTCQVYNQSTCPGGLEWHVNQTNPTCLNSPSCTGGGGGGGTPAPTGVPQPSRPPQCGTICNGNAAVCGSGPGIGCSPDYHCTVDDGQPNSCSFPGETCHGTGTCINVCWGSACHSNNPGPTPTSAPAPATIGGRVYCADNNQGIPNALIDVAGDGRPDYQTNANGNWLTTLNSGINYIAVRFRESSVPYTSYTAPNCAVSGTCDFGGTPSGPAAPNQIYCDPWNIKSHEFCGLNPGTIKTQFNFAFTDCLPCTNPTVTVQVNTGSGFQVVNGPINVRYGDQVRLTPSVVAGTTVIYVNSAGQQVPAISCSSAPGRPSCASSTFVVDSSWGATGSVGRFTTFQYTYSPSVIWNVPRPSCNVNVRTVNIVNRSTAMGFTDAPATCSYGNTSGLKEIGSFTNSRLNNPFQITATYSDLDGVGDIDDVGIWVHNSSGSNPPANPGQAIGARLKRVNATTYQLYSFEYPNATPVAISNLSTNNLAVCLSGTFHQTAGCTITASNPPAGSNAYALPISITQVDANSIRVVWSIGMLNSGVFNGSQNIHLFSRDVAGSNGTWGLPGNGAGTWNADLVPPLVNAQVNPTTPLNFNVNFTASDSGRTLLPAGFAKTCFTPNGPSTAGFTLNQTNPAAPQHVFPAGGHTYTPCFNTSTGTHSYSVSTLPNTPLTYTYQAVDQACNVTTDTDNYVESPGWFLTAGGDAYANTFEQSLGVGSDIEIRNVFNYKTPREALPESGMAPFVSTYNLMHNNAAILSTSSVHRFFVPNYADANSTPRVLNKTWYEFIDYLVIKNNLPVSSLNGQTINGPTSTAAIMGIGAGSGPNVLRVNGNLILNGTFTNAITCNTKTIVFVTGNLDIAPNFITDSGQNGCIFVVRGNTTIRPGSNILNPSPSDTIYERIDAFIITDTFTTQTDANLDGLEIVGGVITRTTSLLRTNGPTKNAFAPAEVFRYDPRYIYIFDGILTLQQSSSIREKQFINSLESPTNNGTGK